MLVGEKGRVAIERQGATAIDANKKCRLHIWDSDSVDKVFAKEKRVVLLLTTVTNPARYIRDILSAAQLTVVKSFSSFLERLLVRCCRLRATQTARVLQPLCEDHVLRDNLGHHSPEEQVEAGARVLLKSIILEILPEVLHGRNRES